MLPVAKCFHLKAVCLTHIHVHFTHCLRTGLTHLYYHVNARPFRIQHTPDDCYDSEVTAAAVQAFAMDRVPAVPAEPAATLGTIPRRALQMGSPATDGSGPATLAKLSPFLSSMLGTRSLSSVAFPGPGGPMPDPAGRKRAPAAVAPADITAVTTAAQLQDALSQGAQDIEIREHLDLDSVAAVPIPLGRQGMFDNSTNPRLVFAVVQEGTRSIRV